MLSRPDFLHKQFLIVFTSRGEKFSFKNANLVIHDECGKIKHQSTCYKLFVLFIVGHFRMTSGLIERTKKHQFSIIFLNHNLRPYASLTHAAEGNFLLRKKQYDYSGLEIAQHIVTNKITNQLNALNKIRDKDTRRIKAKNTLRNQLKLLKKEPHSLHNLLSIEAHAAKVYFKAIFPQEFWNGRKPRTKCDTINTLLDIGYTLAFHLIESLINIYGFDIYYGVYHRCFYQRKSLVCDLIEPFRPIIDYRIRKAYKLGQIYETDFDLRQSQYLLFGKKAAPYINFLMEDLLKHKEEMFLYIQQYYRAFMREKPVSEYPNFTFK